MTYPKERIIISHQLPSIWLFLNFAKRGCLSASMVDSMQKGERAIAYTPPIAILENHSLDNLFLE